ncbi:type II toxin-antitoxin system VapC family toxin [Paracoccus sp. Z118]|uniref:type II toxin-antitoxin system VapC family toxin n=1 Tax=Paracoccus sp. Z118 TaxID=2851017 RepID=UPI001C2BD2C9|nr:type II toxin-antitoxin system VapC family toxin [Paracoccus sp. Z118]MBV0891365.1 type II toxin-antitoxin system VapC family toxin [Paracoccus sp. Z118]
MNLLLDTHLLIWSAGRDDLMTPKADRLIKDKANTLWFSVASIWEVAIKRSRNRADFRTEPGTLRAGLLANGYLELPVKGRHCLAIPTLPHVHGDPFDRMLVAQAMAEGMVLLTADRKIAEYGGPVRMV